MTTSTHAGTTALCVRSIHLMGDGSRADFDRVYSPDAINREAAVEPPADPAARGGRVLCHRRVAARGVLRPALGDPRDRRAE